MIRAFIDSLLGRFLAILFVGLAVYGVYKTIQANALRGQVVELRADLEEAEARLKAALKAIEVIEQIAQDREESRVIVREVTTQILESPNAEVLVPSDIALSWAAGIDRLRDAAIRSGESDTTVRATPSSQRERTDSSEAGGVLGGAGGSAELQ